MELRVLVQWAGGYVVVSNGGAGRVRTVPFNAGDNVKSAAAAQQIGQAYLLTLMDRDSVSPTLAQVDEWPQIGDAVQTLGFDGDQMVQRIRSRTVQLDRNGFAFPTVTLGTPAEELIARQQLAIERLQTGLAGGRSAGVAPSSTLSAGVASGALRSASVPEWSWSSFDEGRLSGPVWEAKEPVVLTKITVLKTDVTPEEISVQVRRSGSPVTLLTIPNNFVSWSVIGSVLVTPGQTLRCVITDLNEMDPETDLEDLKLTVQFESAPASMRVDQRGVSL